MRRISFYFLLTLVSLMAMMTFVSPAVSSTSQTDNTIVIGAGIATAYNVTSLTLEKNTEYTIYLQNASK